MIIESVHVENFGKLKDFDYSFKPGLNRLVYRNGWGKSTLLAFMRVMLYGFENEGKRSEVDNERKRFKPWQGGVYGGSMVFATGGRRYRIEKIFGARASEDSFTLYDADTGIESGDYADPVGEALFGIDSLSFARSVFIGQQAVPTDMTDGIGAQIGNLSHMADDLGAFEKAMDRLREVKNACTPSRKTSDYRVLKDKISRDELELSRRKELEERLAACEEELSACAERERQRGFAREDIAERRRFLAERKALLVKAAQYRELRAEASALEWARTDAGLPAAEELQRWTDAYEVYKSKLVEIKGVDAEIKRCSGRVEALKGATLADGEETPEKPKKTGLVPMGGACLVLGLALLGAGAYFHIGKISDEGMLACIASGAALAIFGIISVIRGLFSNMNAELEYNEAVREIEEAARKTEMDKKALEVESLCLDDLYNRRDRLVGENGETLRKLGEFLAAYGGQAAAEDGAVVREDEALSALRQRIWERDRARGDLGRLEEKMKRFEEVGDAGELLAMEEDAGDGTDPDEELRRLDEESADDVRRAKEAEDASNAIREELGALGELAEVNASDRERLAEMERRYQTAFTTEEFLNRARDSFCSEYMEPVKAGFDRYYSVFDDGDATNWELDARLSLAYRAEGANRDTALLSEGRKDVAGLCRRISFADAMYDGDKPPFFMDDPAVNMDDDNARAAVKVVDMLSADRQVIWFSCTFRG
ncbi:MAG: AAA family ATPase [Eubacterium sp.]|nr:AAA family ATPase [Eubacterium sp.]